MKDTGLPARKAALAILSGVLQKRRPLDAQLEQLAGLEAAAQQRGRALGSGFAYPVTLQEVKHWAQGLSARGLTLAPASAVMARR